MTEHIKLLTAFYISITLLVMDPELIKALNRIADAHNRLADNVGRIADAMIFTEGKVSDLTLADGLVEELHQISNAIDQIGDKLPEPPED